MSPRSEVPPRPEPHPPADQPIRVKFLSKDSQRDTTWRWRRHLPGGNPRIGRCLFLFDREERHYDWLAVYDDLPSVAGERHTLWREPLACPREQTILLTAEPSSVKVYGRGFLRQFGWVLTSQEPWVIRHPRAIYHQTGEVWFYEGDYDEIAAHPPTGKTRLISTVCSSKRHGHTLHRLRYDFTQRLRQVLPELEVWGHGVRPMERKNVALDPYRYHIAIENHVSLHGWTEKLADAFLGLCLPFYFGAPNAADYFPEESFIPIDIRDFEGTVETIRRAIRDNEYEKRLPAIREARRRVIEQYATLVQLARIIEERTPANPPPPTPGAVILSRHAWRRSSPLRALAVGLEKAWVRLQLRLGRTG
ncbi:MAG: glycosyltransferase [Verrucomicrobia bacterium]|nr:MAG: glycosyltransferase [Verrucomicrobiota bacterium]